MHDDHERDDGPPPERLDGALRDLFAGSGADSAATDQVMQSLVKSASPAPAPASVLRRPAVVWLGLATAAGLALVVLAWQPGPLAWRNREAPRREPSPSDASPTDPAPAPRQTPPASDLPASDPPAPWGTLRGRFVYDGAPPEAQPLKIPENSADVALCCRHRLLDESLVIDPTTRGVANVFVYLMGDQLPVHPKAERVAAAPAKVDNVACRFTPHARAVQVGQTVTLANSDPVGHNSHVNPQGDTGCNPLIPAEAEVPYTFNRAQSTPVPITCTLHPWMKAWVLPRSNPYAVVSRPDGSFEIPHLPAGTHEIQLWHERPGLLAARPEWKEGRVEVTIPAGGEIDLGEIRLPPKLFVVK